jgi:hypothetical protein
MSLDQSISLELLTNRISSMTEAIHQVVLYETYERGTRERHNIRQLNTEEPPFVTGNDTEDVEIRKVGGKRFATEEHHGPQIYLPLLRLMMKRKISNLTVGMMRIPWRHLLVLSIIRWLSRMQSNYCALI